MWLRGLHLGEDGEAGDTLARVGEGEEGQGREFQAVVSELATGPYQFSPGAGRVLL